MPAKDTAVGIIYEVARKHPGFRPGRHLLGQPPAVRPATTCGDQKRAVRWLTSARLRGGQPHLDATPTCAGCRRRRSPSRSSRMERLLKKLGDGPVRRRSRCPSARCRARGPRVQSRQVGRDAGSTFEGVFLAGAEPVGLALRQGVRLAGHPADPEQRQEGRVPQVVLAVLAGVAEQAPRRALHGRRRSRTHLHPTGTSG